MAEQVYPMLYVFENSARDIIERVLRAEFGDDWWQEASWSDLRSVVKSRQTSEERPRDPAISRVSLWLDVVCRPRAVT